MIHSNRKLLVSTGDPDSMGRWSLSTPHKKWCRCTNSIEIIYVHVLGLMSFDFAALRQALAVVEDSFEEAVFWQGGATMLIHT